MSEYVSKNLNFEPSNILKIIQSQSSDQNCEGPQEIIIQCQYFPRFTREIQIEMEKFQRLICLSINSCDLEELKYLPQSISLLRLELTYNQIKPDELQYISQYKQLLSLRLSGNPINEMSKILALFQSGVTMLAQIALMDTPVANNIAYRKALFNNFKNLIVVDNLDRDGGANILKESEIILQELHGTYEETQGHEELILKHIEKQKLSKKGNSSRQKTNNLDQEDSEERGPKIKEKRQKISKNKQQNRVYNGKNSDDEQDEDQSFEYNNKSTSKKGSQTNRSQQY